MSERPLTIAVITADELDLNQLVEQITTPMTGAACVFTGVVRGVTHREAVGVDLPGENTLGEDSKARGNNPHETIYLEYEAYIPMAEAKMRQIAEEIRTRWPSIEGIAIIQRIGRLFPGTPTVLIACTSAHRDTGVFEATHYGIDRLKEIVPVWKKEVSATGEIWVEGDYHPTRQD